MVELRDIYKEIARQGAKINKYKIGFSPACTIELCGDYAVKYGVFYDPALCKNTAALKHVLAHECGHCATGATHRTSSRWDIIQKHEYKANRWAIERFLPYDAICEAVQRGCTEYWQLAEYFDVPQSLIEMAVEHYTVHREKRLDVG